LPLLPLALSLASQFAPSIIGLFAGAKAEDVAQKVVGLAQTVTGHTEPEAAVKAIEADPNLALQFQQAVLAQKIELEKIALQRDQLEVTQDANVLADKASARGRDVEIVKAGHPNRRASWMLWGTFAGLFVCLALMIVYHVDANTAIGGALIMLVGKFVSMWGTAFDFEFGSSRSSRAKDDVIANELKESH
jgi:hypothetical protein